MNDPHPLPPPSRPRRRFWTMSLRGLMILVLVVGGLLGWRARRASIQRRAVAIVTAAGGHVTYDFQAPPNRPFQPGASPPGPRWLRALLGDEYFQEVAVIFLQNPKNGPPRITPEVVRAVAEFDHLQSLVVDHVPLDDAAILPLTRISSLRHLSTDVAATETSLAAIRQMPNLRVLQLLFEPANLDGSALRHFQGMDQLEWLQIAGIDSIQPADLTSIASLTGLRKLHLILSPEEAGWFATLKGIPNLTQLEVPLTRPSDGDLDALKDLPKLDSLFIDGSNLTEAGMVTLGRLTSLNSLGLSSPDGSSHPTDAGLAHLASLSKLRMLWIDAGDLTGQGFARLDKLPITSVWLMGLQARHRGLVAHLLTRPITLLSLDGPGLTDQCLETFGSQPTLDQLSLNHTAITDAGLASIVNQVPALFYLSLDGTAITDAGLMNLANVPKLRMICAFGTNITEKGIAALHTIRPKIRVLTGPDVPMPRHPPAQPADSGRRPATLIPLPCPA